MAGRRSKYTGRDLAGGGHWDVAYASRNLMEVVKAEEERAFPIISEEPVPPYKCSVLSKGYLLFQSAAKFPGYHWCKRSVKRISSIIYSKKVLTMSQLPVVFLLFVLLTASSVAARDPNSMERNCQYNMIGLAALSCQHLNDFSEPPTVSCCTSLLHAIDELPRSGESGECCLCHYTLMKVPNDKLARSYVSCQGKDRANVAKWSYPIQSCWAACKKKNASQNMDTPIQKDLMGRHGIGIIKIIAVAVLFLVLLICIAYFCWFRRVAGCQELPVKNNEHREVSSGQQVERRQSSVQLKGRRSSSGRRRSLHGSPNG